MKLPSVSDLGLNWTFSHRNITRIPATKFTTLQLKADPWRKPALLATLAVTPTDVITWMGRSKVASAAHSTYPSFSKPYALSESWMKTAMQASKNFWKSSCWSSRVFLQLLASSIAH